MPDTITAGQLVERTRRWLTGTRSVNLNRISGAIDNAQVEIVLAYDPGPVSEHTYVSIDDEILYVWEVQRGPKTLTVSRGMLGTDAAAHVDLAPMEANARFPRPLILDSLQDEIRSWPDDVFQVKSKPVVGTVQQSAFDLGVRDSDFYNVFSIERSPVLGQTAFTADRWSNVPFRVARQMPRDSFPSGTAIFLTERARTACSLRILYSAPFDVNDIADSDDVVDDWGLSRSMCDIPPYGAAARLLQASEIIRSDASALGESRVATEVPPSYQSQTAVSLRRLADVRIREEAMKLRGRYSFPS